VLLSFAEKFLHGAVNLRRVARTAWHWGDGFAGSLAYDIVEDLFVGGHGTGSKEAATWFEHAVHFAQGEGNVLRVVDGKAGRDQVEVIRGQVEFLVEIKMLEINGMINRLVLFTGFIKQRLGDICAGDLCFSIQMMKEGEALLAGAAANIQDLDPGLQVEHFQHPCVNIF